MTGRTCRGGRACPSIPVVWLAITPYICRINNLRNCLHSAHSVKIFGCLCVFDICSAGFFPSFALGMTSCSSGDNRGENRPRDPGSLEIYDCPEGT